MQNNASLGYFRIYVNDDKSIKFISTSQNNNNSVENSDVDNEESKTEDKSDNKKDQTTKIKEDSDQKEIKCTQKINILTYLKMKTLVLKMVIK